MSNRIQTTVKIDEQAIQDKLDNLIHNETVMTEVHQAFADIINPWVPYDTGNLADKSVVVNAEGVNYTAEYAAKQYYGEDIHHKTEHHPLATAKWDVVAMQTEKEQFIQEVTDILRKNANG